MEIAVTIGSVIIGGLITFFCSKCFYKKAGKELKEEAGELRRLNKLMLLGMEHAGWVTLNRDAQENILGFKYTLNVQSGTMPITDGSATLTHTAKGEEGAKGSESV